jgi:DNA-binding NarL/FixJ family response regulator
MVCSLTRGAGPEQERTAVLIGLFVGPRKKIMPGTLKNDLKAVETAKDRVLILDNLPVVRERVAQLVASEPDLAVCGEADDAREAMHLIATTQPRLVVTSLSLKTGHGLDFIKDLHARYPQVLILVFSMYDELVYAERAIRAGARGFLGKQESTRELMRAIRCILEGEIYMSERVTGVKVTRFFQRSSVKGLAPLEQLSDRELQVLQLTGHGQSTRQIAHALGVDIKTIETYRARIKVKLNLGTAAELAHHARIWLEESTRAR